MSATYVMPGAARACSHEPVADFGRGVLTNRNSSELNVLRYIAVDALTMFGVRCGLAARAT
jgi:hypothetical protein